MSKLLSYSFLLITLFGCYGKTWKENAVDKLLTKYKNKKGTEILLADMNYSGDGSRFYHKYEVLTPDSNGDYQKIETFKDNNVTEGFYALHNDNLGMSIGRINEEGECNTMVAPGGYELVVGNQKYGKFEGAGNTGNWVFHPRYSHYPLLFYWGSRSITGMFYYGMYRTNYRNNRHYYGPLNNWGTKSAETKKTHKSYYSRAKQRSNSWKRNYSNSTSSRGGGGWGK